MEGEGAVVAGDQRSRPPRSATDVAENLTTVDIKSLSLLVCRPLPGVGKLLGQIDVFRQLKLYRVLVADRIEEGKERLGCDGWFVDDVLNVELFVGPAGSWRLQFLPFLLLLFTLLVLSGVVGVHLLLQSPGRSHWFAHLDLLPLPPRPPLLVAARHHHLLRARAGGGGGGNRRGDGGSRRLLYCNF